MSNHLFSLPSDSVAITSDDCYTPRWVFDAMGLEFDLDVAAPPGGPWHVPARAYFTAEDDGLAQSWDGLVWCNPPYGKALGTWLNRMALHNNGIALVFARTDTRAFLASYGLGLEDAVENGVRQGLSRRGHERAESRCQMIQHQP